MSTKRTLIGNIKGKPGDTPYIADNGNWGISGLDTGVKAQGVDGKSAYEYAKEGGYTGTEEEFSQKLNETAMDAYTKAEADAKFLTEESDPTVPAWAKAASKPSYTASEVGADASGSAANALSEAKSYANSGISTHNTNTDAHSDLRLELQALADRVNAALNSTDADLDQMAEIVAYIKSNKSLIDAITTSKVSVSDIINNLTSNVTNKPLSAAQGVALKSLIDAITVPTKTSQLTNDSGYITGYTETDPTVPSWAKAATKPSYSANEVGAVPTTRKVNGKPLSADITLMADSIYGTFGGAVSANIDSAGFLEMPQMRDISAGPIDMTAGSSTLRTGELYFVYE